MYPVSERPTIGGVGAGSRIQVHGRGDIVLKGANGKDLVLKNAAYTPESTVNIFSVVAALRALQKCEGPHAPEHSERLRSTKLMDAYGKTVATSTARGGLYYLDLHRVQDFE
jgi:hypothetical protein